MNPKYERYLLQMRIPPDIKVKIELIRKNAPLTIQSILGKLPFRTRIKKFGDQLIIYFPIKFKAEKTTTKLKRGDVAYWPLSQAICIYLKDTEISSPVTIIGRVSEGLEKLPDITSGLGVTISRINYN